MGRRPQFIHTTNQSSQRQQRSHERHDLKIPCLLQNKIFYSQHTTAPCFFNFVMCLHSCVCTQHLVARSNKPLLLPCYLLVFSPTVVSILSNSHSLRCLALPVRAATAIRRKGWRQRHAPQPFNCAIQRVCTLQYAHVHLQHVFGAFATLTPFTGYELKNLHQWLATV